MWHQADHPVIQVVPALGLAAVLGNSMFTRFGRATSKACLLFSDVMLSGGTVMSCVMSRCYTCTGHVTFCYKRSADTSFEALLALFGSSGSWFVLQVHPCHPHTAGDLGISMRPGSAAPLPVSTTSTGLLCLLVGARVHHGRSDTEVEHMATTTCILHSCVTILGIPGWAPSDNMQPEPWAKAHLSCDLGHQVWIVRTSGKGNTLLYQRVFPLDPYVHMQAGMVHAMIHLGGKDRLG